MNSRLKEEVAQAEADAQAAQVRLDALRQQAGEAGQWDADPETVKLARQVGLAQGSVMGFMSAMALLMLTPVWATWLGVNLGFFSDSSSWRGSPSLGAVGMLGLGLITMSGLPRRVQLPPAFYPLARRSF